MRRGVLLSILAIVVLLCAWTYWTKRNVLNGGAFAQLLGADRPEVDLGQASKTREQLDDFAEYERYSREAAARKTPKPDPNADDMSKPPQSVPGPDFGPASPDEIFPFDPNTPLLQEPVPMPDKAAPSVYVAFGRNAADNRFTSASMWLGEILKFQLRSQRSSVTLLNFMPNAAMLYTLKRAYEPSPQSVSEEQFLADARALAADFLILPVTDDDTTRPRMRVKMVDLHSSRTEEWQPSGQVAQSVPKSILEAAKAVMKFTGLDDETIAKSGVGEGIPTDDTFDRLVAQNPKELDWEFFQKAIATDPDCRLLYSYDAGTTSRLQLCNVGLARFPDDVRLLFGKAIALADNGSTTALIRFTSELLRRYPDNMYVYTSLPNRLDTVYVCTSAPKQTPPEYEAIIKQMDAFSQLYPDNFELGWDHAYSHQALAGYVRGTRTIDRIPREVLSVYSRETEQAYSIMKEVVEKHPKIPALLIAYTYYMTASGAASNSELQEHIERVAELDPRATEAELKMASANSIGYGQAIDYIRIIDRALDHHKGDVMAIADITKAVGKELTRQVSWQQMTQEEAYGTTNSYLARFLDGAKFVYSRGLNLGLDQDRALYYSAELRNRYDLLEKWRKSGQNVYAAMKEAVAANSSGDWERALAMAKKALPSLGRNDDGHLCRYYIIKSLYELKRYDEAMQAARDGILAFPYEQTFPYTYAVVALAAGKNLEIAYDCAWRAVDLNSSNPGINRTFEKLRKMLNKPPHRKLSSFP